MTRRVRDLDFLQWFKLIIVRLNSNCKSSIGVFAISQLCDNKIHIVSSAQHYIYLDSQSAIEVISSNHDKSKNVFECKQRLNELGSLNKVSLICALVHERIPGNEKSCEQGCKVYEQPVHQHLNDISSVEECMS